MNYEIKHRFTGAVLFSLECDSLKLCVQAAVKAKADLRDSDLRGSNLRDSDLRGSNLRDSDLSYSDLRGSNLRDSDLRGSDLSYSDLSYSDLRDSDLSYSDLRGSDLRGSKEAAQLGQPNGWHAWTYLDKEGKQRVRVGCQDKTIADGRLYWADKEDRREVMAALDYAEAIGNLRGWKQ
jgi:uncharacterized protein YjbI with pentapeptide repeats